MQERGTAVETKLLFFELEWAALDDERADELLAADGLETTRHHLRTLRRYRPHLLSEPEEKLLTEKAVTGRDAWTRLFSELDERDPRRAARRRARASRSTSRSAAWSRPTARCAAPPPRRSPRRSSRACARARYVFNTLLQDKAIDDRLRSYPNWLASRNLANEASDESVQALVEAVRANYELPQRWYRLKAELLGLDRLADYDRMAAGRRRGGRRSSWPEATRPRARHLRRVLPRARRRSRSASSTSAGSTRRCARASAAARSAPTRRRACTPT